jgi:hypothetical protein
VVASHLPILLGSHALWRVPMSVGRWMGSQEAEGTPYLITAVLTRCLFLWGLEVTSSTDSNKPILFPWL